MRRLWLAGLLLAAHAARAETNFVVHEGEWYSITRMPGLMGPHKTIEHICYHGDRPVGEAILAILISRVPGYRCAQADKASLTFHCTLAGIAMQLDASVASNGPDNFTTRLSTLAPQYKLPMPDLGMTNTMFRLGPCQKYDTQAPKSGR